MVAFIVFLIVMGVLVASAYRIKDDAWFWEVWAEQRDSRRRSQRREAERRQVEERAWSAEAGRVDRGKSALRDMKVRRNIAERTPWQLIPGLDPETSLSAWGYRCAWCGNGLSEQNLHWDHVMPLAMEGSNHATNVVPACADCNLAKGAKHPSDWKTAMGRRLRQEALNLTGTTREVTIGELPHSERVKTEWALRLALESLTNTGQANAERELRRLVRARRKLSNAEMREEAEYLILLARQQAAIWHPAYEGRQRGRHSTYKGPRRLGPVKPQPSEAIYKLVRRINNLEKAMDHDHRTRGLIVYGGRSWMRIIHPSVHKAGTKLFWKQSQATYDRNNDAFERTGRQPHAL